MPRSTIAFESSTWVSQSQLELNHRSEHVCSEPRQTWAPPRWPCHHGAQGGPMALRATHTSCCCCGTRMLMDVELNRLDTLRWHCQELARCNVSAPLRSPAPVCAPRAGFLIIRSVAGLQPARRRRESRPQSAPCAAVPTGLRFACWLPSSQPMTAQADCNCK